MDDEKTDLEPSANSFPNRRSKDLFNRALNVFVDDEVALKEKKWNVHRSVENLPAGGYWISKRGTIYQIPQTHADSIANLPELVTSVFNQTISRAPDSPLKGENRIREAFMVESGWVRFRIHPLHDVQGENSRLVDMTIPPAPTDTQRRLMTALHHLKHTSVHEYVLDTSGQITIAHREQTPYRMVKAAVEASSIDKSDPDLHDPRIEQWRKDPRLRREINRGD